MGRVEKTVFVSYRRTNIPWALAIFQNLDNHGYDVFVDYTGIASGDFEQVILGKSPVRISSSFSHPPRWSVATTPQTCYVGRSKRRWIPSEI
jgi:hypothetical protein